jgi:hypothetical protein
MLDRGSKGSEGYKKRNLIFIESFGLLKESWMLINEIPRLIVML